MRVTSLYYLLASVYLLEASANPLRVIVSESTKRPATDGLAFIQPYPNHPNPLIPPSSPNTSSKRPCRMRQKATEISNAFRKALGLPLIEVSPFHGHGNVGGSQGSGESYSPLVFVGTPGGPMLIKVDGNSGDVKPGASGVTTTTNGDPNRAAVIHMHHHGQDNGIRRHGGCHGFRRIRGFMTRLHRALMALGPWEGRAVAFVLGCGIGVLLRMVWVLAVISYRFAKGGPEIESAQYTLVTDQDEDDEPAEILFIAPPSYVNLEDEKKPADE